MKRQLTMELAEILIVKTAKKRWECKEHSMLKIPRTSHFFVLEIVAKTKRTSFFCPLKTKPLKTQRIKNTSLFNVFFSIFYSKELKIIFKNTNHKRPLSSIIALVGQRSAMEREGNMEKLDLTVGNLDQTFKVIQNLICNHDGYIYIGEYEIYKQ